LWISSVWRSITFDEIVYHLGASLEGTGTGMIVSCILRVFVPTIVLTVLACVAANIMGKKKGSKAFFAVYLGAIAIVLVVTLCLAVKVNRQYGIVSYFRSQSGSSTFMDDNYVDPDDVDINFPEQKRNLIYIFLESMEITYTDASSGGAFADNVIPELTDLALNEGECFNGSTGTLNGGIVTFGATWTMSALMAQTSGTPIVTGIDNAKQTSSDSFYPQLTAIGNILQDEGYNQVFMCGSEAVFGGRAEYFKEHGSYMMFDYTYALENGFIPEGYYVWWGYEDEKLFEFAKTELLELAAEDEPFNFTMLTADTHFEDGYVCELCEDLYGDQYANVMRCSNRQVAEFVEWIKEQDFYENTTIVICGDHTTMDSDFCDGVSEDYQRKTYVNVLNSACEYEGETARVYTTLDLFPTTLAAMGCEIEGNRLGLGVNLYSDEATLAETYALDVIDSELSMSSDYYRKFGEAGTFSGSVLVGTGLVDVRTYEDSGNVLIEVEGLENADENPDGIKATLYDEAGTSLGETELVIGTDKIYRGNISADISAGDVALEIIVTDKFGYEDTLYSGSIFEEEPEEEQLNPGFTFRLESDDKAEIVYPLVVPSGTVPGWIYVWDDNDPELIRKFILGHMRVTNADGSESIYITNDNVDLSGLDKDCLNMSVYFYHDDYGVVYSNRYENVLENEYNVPDVTAN